MRHAPLYLMLAALGLTAASVHAAEMAAAAADTPDSAASTAAKTASDSEESPDVRRLDVVRVTGSRIPRAQVEGPAPVTVITAQDIKAQGLATVYDVVRSLTQSTGSVQPQQFQGFTPGAAQVDLRGLGPNYTLVLLNGRRIADFPLAYNAQSNFTDIANIPASLIDRVEILTGSASAVYGSDAVAGVVNFILKKKADGTTLDYRVGGMEEGGGASQRLQLSTGGTYGALDAIFGVEFYTQKPVYQYQRDFQDSLTDDPTLTGAAIPSRVFLRWNPATRTYIDPGAATCAALAGLDRGSITYSFRPNRGHFCGSTEALYGTVQNDRENVVGYSSLTYHVSEDFSLYGDFQAAYTKTKFGGGPNFWSYTGRSDNTFFNGNTGQLESWQRLFTPEEVGGLEHVFDYNRDHTYAMNVGVQGHFGDWDYDAGYSHSSFRMVQAHRAVLAAEADKFFLGDSHGIDPTTGYTIFTPDPKRLYTPLTQAEYESISLYTPINAHTRSEAFTFTLDNAALFELPAGPVGAAAVAEYGNQAYAMNIDPDVLANRYFAWTGTGGAGSRDHYAVGAELRVPVLANLTLTPAERYDSYSYSNHDTAKPTHSLGLEWRPFESLLVRGSAATSFRAPDLHYVYAQPSGAYYTLTDYYLCRTREPGTSYNDCTYGGTSVKGTRNGNAALDSETGKSFTYGVVWSPSENVALGADWYSISLDNTITDRDLDEILRTEADCRIGRTESGTAIDIHSPSCQRALALVQRNPADALVNPGQISGAHTYPINASALRNTGIDASFDYRLPTDRWGDFKLHLGYTVVLKYTYRQFPGDPTRDVRNDRAYDNLRSKANGSLAWTYGKFTTTVFGTRMGSLPTYDQRDRIGPSMNYNASIEYAHDENLKFTFIVDNVFNSPPHRDATRGAYPYYDQFQFDPFGRQYYLEVQYRFGGK